MRWCKGGKGGGGKGSNGSAMDSMSCLLGVRAGGMKGEFYSDFLPGRYMGEIIKPNSPYLLLREDRWQILKRCVD